MSAPTIPATKAYRSAEPSTFAHAPVETSPSHLDQAATQVHLALGGKPAEHPAEDVMDAVREAVRTVRSRRAPTVSTDGMADHYRVMTHPEEYCHPAWCLAQVKIDPKTGRPWHNAGTHRRAVRSMEAEYGVLLQVGIGVDDDFELNLDHPFVHVWQADLDDNDGIEQLHLTAAEADRLGDFLKAAARELRSTRSRIAEDAARETAGAAVAEQLPAE